MTKFVFVFHGGTMAETEAEQEEVMAAWGAWFGQMGEAVIEPGNPFAQNRTVGSGGTSNGGGDNPATGYTVVQADSIDAAADLAKGCPILDGGGTVEVCEAIDM